MSERKRLIELTFWELWFGLFIMWLLGMLITIIIFRC